LLCHLVHLTAYIGGRRARSITAADIRAYATMRLHDDHAKPATVNRELAKLNAMFSNAIEDGDLNYKPKITLLDEIEYVRSGFFEPQMFEAILTRLPGHLKPIVEFDYYVGWRLGEVNSLQWADSVVMYGRENRATGEVNIGSRTASLRPGRTKNRRARFLPLEGELWRIIQHQYENRPSDCPWVFYRPDGGRIISFRKAWRRACKAAGYPNMLFHDFRRTAARNLRRAGLAESEAMRITGHATVQIFRRYSIVSEDDLRDVVWRGQAFAAAERHGVRGSDCGKNVATDAKEQDIAGPLIVAKPNPMK
jgi:integrase